ncbi:hypothetical protein C8F01DRAFT_448788 [Mycena amicta]|nr:hypothetical protein C8F01DRAFT_448788 [Mycena amicta]
MGLAPSDCSSRFLLPPRSLPTQRHSHGPLTHPHSANTPRRLAPSFVKISPELTLPLARSSHTSSSAVSRPASPSLRPRRRPTPLHAAALPQTQENNANILQTRHRRCLPTQKFKNSPRIPAVSAAPFIPLTAKQHWLPPDSMELKMQRGTRRVKTTAARKSVLTSGQRSSSGNEPKRRGLVRSGEVNECVTVLECKSRRQIEGGISATRSHTGWLRERRRRGWLRIARNVYRSKTSLPPDTDLAVTRLFRRGKVRTMSKTRTRIMRGDCWIQADPPAEMQGSTYSERRKCPVYPTKHTISSLKTTHSHPLPTTTASRYSQATSPAVYGNNPRPGRRPIQWTRLVVCQK